jgi:tetratricopeptide (TPR) repeat protein
MTRRTWILATAIALLLASVAPADRETAQFAAGRADKALAAKKWDEAESLYRKALEEDGTFLPAHYGLAQALLGAGKSAPGVEELRAFVDGVHAATSAPADWKALAAKAEKQMLGVDAAGAALQKIEDGYADALVELGRQWMTKDPVIAERALRRALKVKPGNPKAAELLEKMGKSANADVIDLFDGKSLNGWVSANAPEWQVVDGNLVGTAKDSTFGCRSERSFQGDFDVHFEAKLLEEYGGKTIFALTSCWKGDYDHYGVGFGRGKFWWFDFTGEGKNRTVADVAPTQMKKPFDPKEWNTYMLRYRGEEVTAFLNGEEIAKEARPERRKDGFVGILNQNGKVAFRKVQVELK